MTGIAAGNGPSTAPEAAPAAKSQVVRGSVWLFVVLGLQSVAGVVFLKLATYTTNSSTHGARVDSASVVGLATALFTGLQFVNYASALGLDVALARFAARRNQQSDALFGWALVATALSSLALTIGYLAIIASRSTSLLRGSVGGYALFFAMAGGVALHSLVDVRLMAARRWQWMLAKMSVLSAVRLTLVFVHPPFNESVWLFMLLAGPTAIAGIVGIVLLPVAEAGGVSFKRPAQLGEVSRYAGVNWVAALAFGAPQFTLPIIVQASKMVSDQEFGNFFLAWSFTQPVFFIPAAIHQVLMVEGSRGEDEAGGRRRSFEAMALSAGLAAVAFAGSIVVAPWIPTLYNSDFKRAGHLLPPLMAGAVPWAISTIRLAEARLRHDHVTTVAITMTFGIGVLGLALWLVPSHGTNGAVKAWLIGNAAAAVISVVLGGVRSRRRVLAARAA